MSEISAGTALLTAVTGYAVVFGGLVLLMIVMIVMGRIMQRSGEKAAAAAAGAVAEAEKRVASAVSPIEVNRITAPGTAGQLKLYNTDPRDAAMIMAIVADSLGKPLNELRFISIREVTDEV